MTNVQAVWPFQDKVKVGLRRPDGQLGQYDVESRFHTEAMETVKEAEPDAVVVLAVIKGGKQ